MNVSVKILYLFLFSFLFFSPESHAQKKTAHAARLPRQPKVDGILNDDCWKLCDSIDDFTQYIPVYNAKASQRTVVRIGYDDEAIYVAAMMYDTAPDSIYREIGVRDDDLNADKITVQFDTYHMQTDAYTFMVWASGTQADWRENDGTYNAIWQSAVKLNDKGWACEMKINYSALRFPKIKDQIWGLQLFRGIRRYRETDQWSLEKKSNANYLTDWGILKGIKDVDPPLRLSLTPFISLYGDHYPFNEKGKSNYSYSFSGGADLKYGINESYTLDVTLLPDFSQIKSDYLVKNISALETVYEEHRPFFKEATDLFMQEDLFYTRRIGKLPSGFYAVNDSLKPGEIILKNPGQSRMINAVKLSGRNKKGTAFGVFNAITNNMYAVLKDSSGSTRKLLTEPLTNCNIFVFDQVLKNNSKIYFINTNVIRDKKYNNANVSMLGLTLNDKHNMYRLYASGALSKQFYKQESRVNLPSEKLGFKYALSLSKVSGNILFDFYWSQMNDAWNVNDLGISLRNNLTTAGFTLNYNIYEPFWKIRNAYTRLNVNYTENYLAEKIEEFQINLSNNFTTNKYLTVWEGFTISPVFVNNFVDTRVPGRFFVMERWFYANVGFSSDYRKKLALDMNFEYWQDIQGDGQYFGVTTTPIFRLTDHFTFQISNTYEESINDVGFADFDDLSNIILGKRDLTTVENEISARYMFKNNLSLSLLARHYWSKGRYSQFYKLDYDGQLITDPLYDPGNSYNFNFNAFNIDLMFFWEFAPGSSLNITYKNNLLSEGTLVTPSYFRNFRNIFEEKQLNSLSVKVIYYLDYQQVNRLANKKKYKKT
ncbi:MAG TPA: DUF5916 domain-containing protein [Bacteroidales bacterium]|nr:DUF5916 domain-containing protein [Bacteroidales bacterium]